LDNLHVQICFLDSNRDEFDLGSIPGVSFGQMKLQIKLGVPHSLQKSLDMEKVKSVFP